MTLPDASSSLSVPMLEPYMLYQKLTTAMPD